MQTRFLAVPLLGAIAVVLIMLVLSVAPAFGQAQGDDLQYDAVCQNILGLVGDITTGDQTATATAASRQYSKAVAAVAQAQGVSIEQVNECLNGAAGTGGDDDGDVRSADGVLASTIPSQKVLANTGGAGTAPAGARFAPDLLGGALETPATLAATGTKGGPGVRGRGSSR